MRFDLKVKNWRSYLPLWATFEGYRRVDIGPDLIAGLILGVITIPQAIAYAFLAGLPAQAGLYACLVPMVVYAMLGSSRHLVVGPVAVAALMVANAIGEYAPAYSNDYLGIATILSLQVGLFLWVLRLLQMGGVVNLLSHAVITGFVNAAALLIVVSQLHPFFGLTSTATENSPVARLEDLVSQLDNLNPAATAIGAGSIVCLLFFSYLLGPLLQRIWRDFPLDHPITKAGPIIAALLAGLTVWLLALEQQAVLTVGAIPGGLPGFQRPPFDLALWQDLAPVSALIAFVAYIESYSVGATLATRERTRVNSHQELIALGAANVGAAFTGAYPVAGSFTRSSVNYSAGAHTQVSSLVCMGVIVLVLLFLTPLFERLPQSALAAIIIVSVLGLIDVVHVREQWRFHRSDVITQFATLVAVLMYNVEIGLIVGVLLSIAFLVRDSSRPYIAEVGRMPGTEQFKAISRYDVETVPHVAAVRIDESLYFANANQIENKLFKIIERRRGTKHLLLIFSAINRIDSSGLEMLYRVNDNLRGRGIRVHLADVKARPLRKLQQTEFITALSGRIYFTTDQAMQALAEID